MSKAFKRPTYISILSVIGIAWSLLSFLYVFAPSVKKVGIWFPALLGLIVAARFISMIGVWHMKKWGIILFFLAVLSKISFALLLNQLSAVEVVLSVLLLVSFLFYFNRMDDNL
ncbi:MAG TPA: hypothetical protein VNZ86_00715 [Bacteroidia bacterium]|jgi:hypothetical protein|nr:hypothetical protein [Bacteroidia bacterium]